MPRCAIVRTHTPSLYRRERVSSLHKGESVPLLYIEERVSLFYKGRREAPSRCKGECVSLPGREDAIVFLSASESVFFFSTERMTYSFFVQRSECMLYTEERVSLYYL